MPPKDYYKLLQVHPEADLESIEAAYRRLAAKFDPEAAPDDPAVAAARAEVDEAFAILSNPDERAAYDASLSAGADETETEMQEPAPEIVPLPVPAPAPARGRLPSYTWVAAVAVAAIAIIALVFVLRDRRPSEQVDPTPTVVAQATGSADSATPAPAAVTTPAATQPPFPTTDASGPYIMPASIPNFAVADRPERSKGSAEAPVVMYEWSDYT